MQTGSGNRLAKISQLFTSSWEFADFFLPATWNKSVLLTILNATYESHHYT